MDTGPNKFLRIAKIALRAAFGCLYSCLIVLSACQSPPTDLRAFAPGDALIYLETNNLARTLDALTASQTFREAAQSKPDFSALKNMQLAVVVTGFETSEKQLTEESSVLNFKPRFVAIADTYAWNWQTLSFVENRLGEFVNETHGGEVTLETGEKWGGKFFTWTATDGRKVFALVRESRVFFGNDEAAIEKCLAVGRGEAESINKTAKNFGSFKDVLAAGYVSSDGVAQMAAVAGVSAAIETTEDENARSFIARLLPPLLQNSVEEIVWTATKTDRGIEDQFFVQTPAEISSVFRETLVSTSAPRANLAEHIPSDASSATLYNVQNPQIAWRSLLFVAAKQTDAPSGQILIEAANGLLEAYGVADAEMFLSAIGSEILTAELDAEGEKRIVVATVKDAEKVKKSIAEISFKIPAEKNADLSVWKSADGELAAAFVGDKLILGDTESVARCLQSKQNGENLIKNPLFKYLRESQATAVTLGKDSDSAEKVIEVLGKKKAENLKVTTNYLTETRFSEKGIERRTVSPFGLLGTIIEQFE